MFDYENDTGMTFGLQVVFYKLSQEMDTIRGYKQLLESVENFHPEDVERYKKDLNKLIKFETNTLVSTLKELDEYYNNFKEDTSDGL